MIDSGRLAARCVIGLTRCSQHPQRVTGRALLPTPHIGNGLHLAADYI